MEGQTQTQVHNGYSHKLGELLANTKNKINYYGETYVLHNEKINVTSIDIYDPFSIHIAGLILFFCLFVFLEFPFFFRPFLYYGHFYFMVFVGNNFEMFFQYKNCMV